MASLGQINPYGGDDWNQKLSLDVLPDAADTHLVLKSWRWIQLFFFQREGLPEYFQQAVGLIGNDLRVPG
jgi:hypothetical protein